MRLPPPFSFITEWFHERQAWLSPPLRPDIFLQPRCSTQILDAQAHEQLPPYQIPFPRSTHALQGGLGGGSTYTIKLLTDHVIGNGSFGVVFEAKIIETGETVGTNYCNG